MEAVFLKLVNMSITASWLVLAVIGARLVLKKAPRALHCALWALVALRLVCPFSFESALSLIPRAEPVSGEILYFTDAEYDRTADEITNAFAGREIVCNLVSIGYDYETAQTVYTYEFEVSCGDCNLYEETL